MPQAEAIDFDQAASPVVGTVPLFANHSADVASDAAPHEAPATAPSEELDALDLVGLTERFAQSLKQRRAKAVAAPLAQPEAVEADAAPLALPTFSPAEPLPVQAPVQAPDSPLPTVAVQAETHAETLPPLVLPSALRPINLDHVDDDDGEDHSNLLPLRRIAMPAPVAAAPEPAPVPVAFDPAPTPVEAPSVADLTATESDEDTEDDSEGAYSSLLDLNRDPAPRQQFVRIDEPAAQSDAVEPVVIFPGQAAPEGLRQFDAPAAAQFGQPITSQADVTNHDPEETERALRAALASLQRMSGAA